MTNRELNACSCGKTHLDYDGPRVDCPKHGIDVETVRWLNANGLCPAATPAEAATLAYEAASETTTSNEYEVRYPSGGAVEFNDIGDALDWQASSPAGTALVQRTVTTTVVTSEWAEVSV